MDNPKSRSSREYVHYYGHVACDAVVSIHAGGAGQIRGRCHTIGGSGFEARVDSKLPLDHIMQVDFSAPGLAKPVTLSAKVVRSEGFLHLFEIVAPGDAQKQMLSAFLREIVEELGGDDTQPPHRGTS